MSYAQDWDSPGIGRRGGEPGCDGERNGTGTGIGALTKAEEGKYLRLDKKPEEGTGIVRLWGWVMQVGLGARSEAG